MTIYFEKKKLGYSSWPHSLICDFQHQVYIYDVWLALQPPFDGFSQIFLCGAFVLKSYIDSY